MKGLDATFLIDYLAGEESTREYLQGHDSERFVLPTPTLAEALVGEGTGPGQSDIAGLRENLSWAEGYPIDEQPAVVAATIADDIGPHGPFLTGMDAGIAAVGRELDAPIVSSDGDLTHEAIQAVVDVERY